MYVQDRVEEHCGEILRRVDRGAHIYLCGRRGMVPSILSVLAAGSAREGVPWASRLKKWKQSGQWHVEVY